MNDFDLTSPRTFKATHPWISFRVDTSHASPKLWIMLGECHSKCEHLANVPLEPSVGEELHLVYLAKGIAATTAIEGNTLSEDQVRRRVEHKDLKLSASQEYQRQEVDNVLEGCNSILHRIVDDAPVELTPEWIKELNRTVLANLERDETDARPGEIRQYSVGVGRYKGAPAEDCEYLLDRLCRWLNGDEFKAPHEMEILYAILKAIIAHLYIAWIHPFGDGNGRTARLVEVQILLASGVPSVAAQLLSNHYNRTRADYYRHLDLARRDINEFLLYAVRGFRDCLREQIEVVRDHQWNVSWVNYVHKTFESMQGAHIHRKRHLVLDLSKVGEPVPFAKLSEISPRVAVAYKDLASRTLARDIEELVNLELVVVENKLYRANKEKVLAFLPARKKPAEVSTK